MSAASDALGLFSSPWTHVRDRAISLLTFQGYLSLLQVFFLAVVVYAALTRAYLPRRARGGPGGAGAHALEERALAAKLAAWAPAPLALGRAPGRGGDAVDDVCAADAAAARVVLRSAAGPVVRCAVGGREYAGVVNVASFNFLGLVGDQRVVRACEETMRKYGCGACGPRGFYGTVDVHLECEAALARMFGVDDAILYSFGSSAGSSVIPAFCKRGDLVVCDKGISFALQTGVNLSRADVSWFRHNDVTDLERALVDAVAGDVKDAGAATRQRRFIIVEGLYANYGDVAPLDEIVRLKDKYHFRVILDESCSLGALGASGRGAAEHFRLARDAVAVTTADLGNAFATVGGVCVGEKGVVSHQRLSGAGYCFSASQPPFLATAATEAIRVLDRSGAALVARAKERVAAFRSALGVPALREAGWEVDGDRLSPLLHIRAKGAVLQSELVKIREECLDEGVLVGTPRYVATEAFRPKPSVRVAISAAHDVEHVCKAAKVIREVLLRHKRGSA